MLITNNNYSTNINLQYSKNIPSTCKKAVVLPYFFQKPKEKEITECLKKDNVKPLYDKKGCTN